MSERVFRQIDGQDQPHITYTLKRPIQFGSETISELHFREPFTKDLIGVNLKRVDEDIEEMLTLAGRLCAKSPAVLHLMRFVDMRGVSDLVSDFFLDSPETPPTS